MALEDMLTLEWNINLRVLRVDISDRSIAQGGIQFLARLLQTATSPHFEAVSIVLFVDHFDRNVSPHWDVLDRTLTSTSGPLYNLRKVEVNYVLPQTRVAGNSGRQRPWDTKVLLPTLFSSSIQLSTTTVRKSVSDWDTWQ